MPDDYEILLVEDDDADAELTLRALRKAGLAGGIRRAADGVEALDIVFCRGPHAGDSVGGGPRLVLLDLKLPRVGGHEVLRAIKSDVRTRATPVVVLSSSNHERDLAECYELGANSFIQKPIDPAEFLETVHQLGLYWMLVNQPPPRAI
jgi:two-component system response regulator